MAGRAFLVLALGAASAWADGSTRTCYFPDGTVADADIPCTNSTYTQCCGKGGICMTNGYCLVANSQPFSLSRGSCTDSSWGSGCPERCHGSGDNPSGGITLGILKVASGVTSYCCGLPVLNGGVRGCPNDEQSFTLTTGSMIPGVAALEGFTNETTTNSETTLPTTANSTGSSGAAACPESHEVEIGAGIGAALGAIAIAAVCWAFWERRRASRAIQQSAGAGISAWSPATAKSEYANSSYTYPPQQTPYQQTPPLPQQQPHQQQQNPQAQTYSAVPSTASASHSGTQVGIPSPVTTNDANSTAGLVSRGGYSEMNGDSSVAEMDAGPIPKAQEAGFRKKY